ncbi:hypothetical protein EIP86_001224 [Pleurotus ostreatoroseus]|nr:hypothetical protein EIP86_001224 [Pleurotus ostreatoroseus]
MSRLPETMKAFVTQESKMGAVIEIPVPTIDDDEILVQIMAVAQNPTDWKYLRNVTNVGTICGCDWSGYVVKIGKNVKSFANGDHAAGFVQGGTYTDRGAFAEFVKTPAGLAWQVPRETFSSEEAATMGCAFYTAVQALFHPTRLALVEPPAKVDKDEWILVYGGSSSVGMFAIQLAKLAGYQVITTCSPHNFDLVKALGADHVVNYREPAVVREIRDVTKNSLRKALDTISELPSQEITVKAMGSGTGTGKVITLLPVKPEVQSLRDDVNLQGQEINHRGSIYPASPEDRRHMAQFLTKVPGMVSAGMIKPNPIKVWKGGLYGINDGLQSMMEGKASGEKIVYKVD